jgi:DNA-binding response OmpR family regulator
MTKNKKILWIDDDYFHLKGLTRSLEKDGYKITVARSYEEAKNELDRNTDFCIVLLDLIIPYSLTGNKIKDKTPDKSDKLVETPGKLAEHGVSLFNDIKKILPQTTPIIILSIVQAEEIISDLIKNGAHKRLIKLGLLPNTLKNTVLESLDNSD